MSRAWLSLKRNSTWKLGGALHAPCQLVGTRLVVARNRSADNNPNSDRHDFTSSEGKAELPLQGG